MLSRLSSQPNGAPPSNQLATAPHAQAGGSTTVTIPVTPTPANCTLVPAAVGVSVPSQLTAAVSPTGCRWVRHQPSGYWLLATGLHVRPQLTSLNASQHLSLGCCMHGGSCAHQEPQGVVRMCQDGCCTSGPCTNGVTMLSCPHPCCLHLGSNYVPPGRWCRSWPPIVPPCHPRTRPAIC